jgi:hypothetical protein
MFSFFYKREKKIQTRQIKLENIIFHTSHLLIITLVSKYKKFLFIQKYLTDISEGFADPRRYVEIMY